MERSGSWAVSQCESGHLTSDSGQGAPCPICKEPRGEIFLIRHYEAKEDECVFCGEKVDPFNCYQLVNGWEAKRHQGGTNAIRLRATQPSRACVHCIDKQARGLNVGQEALL